MLRRRRSGKNSSRKHRRGSRSGIHGSGTAAAADGETTGGGHRHCGSRPIPAARTQRAFCAEALRSRQHPTRAPVVSRHIDTRRNPLPHLAFPPVCGQKSGRPEGRPKSGSMEPGAFHRRRRCAGSAVGGGSCRWAHRRPNPRAPRMFQRTGTGGLSSSRCGSSGRRSGRSTRAPGR